MKTRALSFKPAATISLEELAAKFNAAFTGYFYPMALTAETLSRRVRHEQIDLQHSLLAYDESEFVGCALLGVRGRRGWCGGFGITPEHRGRGRAQEMMRDFIEEARAAEVQTLCLEVLTKNIGAIRLYQRAGMNITRDLLILERAGEMTSQRNTFPEVAPAKLLRHFERLHLLRPAWQRDLVKLLVLEGARGFCLGTEEAPDAYFVLWEKQEGEKLLVDIFDLAAADSRGAEDLCAALAQLKGTLRILNEPEDSIFIKPLLLHGFIETERQHEMVLELSP